MKGLFFKLALLLLTGGLNGLLAFNAHASEKDSYQQLKKHKVYQVVKGRWRGEEANEHFLTGKKDSVHRDFRIGPSADGSKLVFESLVEDYLGTFSYYDEDCLQYDEYGFVQHLCMGPSGYVAWSGPCPAGSYRTRMTKAVEGGKDVLIKFGDHWNHQGKLHRRNIGTFVRVQDN